MDLPDREDWFLCELASCSEMSYRGWVEGWVGVGVGALGPPKWVFRQCRSHP